MCNSSPLALSLEWDTDGSFATLGGFVGTDYLVAIGGDLGWPSQLLRANGLEVEFIDDFAGNPVVGPILSVPLDDTHCAFLADEGEVFAVERSGETLTIGTPFGPSDPDYTQTFGIAALDDTHFVRLLTTDPFGTPYASLRLCSVSGTTVSHIGSAQAFTETEITGGIVLDAWRITKLDDTHIIILWLPDTTDFTAYKAAVVTVNTGTGGMTLGSITDFTTLNANTGSVFMACKDANELAVMSRDFSTDTGTTEVYPVSGTTISSTASATVQFADDLFVGTGAYAASDGSTYGFADGLTGSGNVLGLWIHNSSAEVCETLDPAGTVAAMDGAGYDFNHQTPAIALSGGRYAGCQTGARFDPGLEVDAFFYVWQAGTARWAVNMVT